MYQNEVPLYGTLLDVVHQANDEVIKSRGTIDDLPARYEVERHGAIRLGTPDELATIRRLFGVLGMSPVDYYDLPVAGLPLHATAFRLTDTKSLSKNPFRVFTSVLRIDMLRTETVTLVQQILSKRGLFSPRLIELIRHSELGNMLTDHEADELIVESLKIFKWHARTPVTISDYHNLQQEHPVIADIVCFPSAHINHLTPPTLDIDVVQCRMIRQGLPAKDRVEGPPPPCCSILLR